jgi:hypothetical protein
VCDLHAAYTRSRSAADEAAWKDAKAKMYRLLERLRATEFSGVVLDPILVGGSGDGERTAGGGGGESEGRKIQEQIRDYERVNRLVGV